MSNLNFSVGKARINAQQTLLFASATAFMVANIYYSQPLLSVIANQFGTSSSSTALLVTLTQLGYGLGVLLLVPLGDILDRRRLASIMIALCIAALVLTAISQSFWFFASMQLLLGMASSAAMVFIPYVASHSDIEVRGRRVGQVITGLLLGILLARTVSGVITDSLGWRWMFVLAACVAMLVLIVIRRVMVAEPIKASTTYISLLKSMGELLRDSRELRNRSLYAMLGMGSFSALWIGLTLLLSSEPFNYSPSIIGLFGLIGASGAMSAGLAGKLSDRGHVSSLTGGLAILLALSWAMMAEAETSLTLLIVGILLLDVAAMGLQVTHQSVLYKINAQAQSRITSVFVTAGFIGMAIGSALSSVAFRHWGWMGVCIVGTTLPSLMLVHWIYTALQARSRNKRMIE